MKLIFEVEVETYPGFDLFPNAEEFRIFLEEVFQTTMSYGNVFASVTSKVVEE